jgi:hypothetical protein
VLVAHTCYLGGRDQEDCSLKPAWANGFQDQKKKRAGGVAQSVEHCLASGLLPPKKGND